MMKEITTGTEITFKKTGDKFTLTQTDTGFDVKQIKMSKSIPAEPYTFQELLDLYELGQLSIEGFEDTDASLVKSILINYIHTTEINSLKADNARLNNEKQQLETLNQQLIAANNELTASNKDFTIKNEKLNETISALQED